MKKKHRSEGFKRKGGCISQRPQRKAEDRSQKSGVRSQESEDRRQKTENRRGLEGWKKRRIRGVKDSEKRRGRGFKDSEKRRVRGFKDSRGQAGLLVSFSKPRSEGVTQ